MADVEAIKRLKSTYLRLLDTRDYVEMRGLLAPGLKFTMGDSEAEPVTTTADDYLRFAQERTGTAFTLHQATNPEVLLGEAGRATGIWAMVDWVDDPDHGRSWVGHGHYYDTFAKSPDCTWTIASIRIERLRVRWLLPPSENDLHHTTPPMTRD